MHNDNINRDLIIIKDLVTNNDVVLFMKGTANSPMCGYSGRVVAILNTLNVRFLDVNVLNSDLRERIKVFSDWPTIPQLYVKGEFIGGCDIVTEMYNTGEFEKLLKDKGIKINKV